VRDCPQATATSRLPAALILRAYGTREPPPAGPKPGAGSDPDQTARWGERGH